MIGSSPASTTAKPFRVWTINGDFLGLHPIGVARYAREVTLALDALVGEQNPLTEDLEIAVVAPRMPRDPLHLQHIPLRVVPEFSSPRLPQFWAQAQLPWHVAGGLLSFCNLAPVLVRKHIVCIHDLQTRTMPESYGRMFRWAHRIILPILGHRAACITTVSDFSRDHLVKFGIARREKIAVTYNGSDHAMSWKPERSGLEIDDRRPFVLCLGRKEKHKNVELLVRLAAPLDRMGLNLYMAGDIDEAALAAFSSEKQSNLRLLGRISDDDLAKALSKALCFLFPSRSEGFGLPAIEAMALGCPLIASTAPCIPEVCGDAALFADPDDTAGWVAAVRKVQTHPQLWQSMVAKGYARARAFSWRRAAEIYLRLMAELDGVDPAILAETEGHSQIRAQNVAKTAAEMTAPRISYELNVKKGRLEGRRQSP